MRPAWARLGWAVSVAAGFAVAGLSRWSYDPVEGEDAVLRLAWRAPGERVEECRVPTAEELEGVPVHMRQAEICEGRLLPYHLRVYAGDELLLDEKIEPAGARADRPLYVFRELPRPAGEQRVRVEWRLVRDEEREAAAGQGEAALPDAHALVRHPGEGGEERGRALGSHGGTEDDDSRAAGDEDGEGREDDEDGDDGEGPRAGGPPKRVPPHRLRLDTLVTAGPREVVLITLDRNTGELLARTTAAGPPTTMEEDEPE